MFINSPHLPKQRASGLTLVELIMFIMVISIAVLGIVEILNYTTRNSADPQQRKQALAIAEGLLEEVELAHFTYCDPTDATAESATGAFLTVTPGVPPIGCTSIIENVGQNSPEPVNGRPYDNVNDYVDGYGTGTPKTYTTDATGAPFPSGYTATIAVVPEALNGIASGSAPATTEVLRITVTVTYGNGSITLDGYRTRYNPKGPNGTP